MKLEDFMADFIKWVGTDNADYWDKGSDITGIKILVPYEVDGLGGDDFLFASDGGCYIKGGAGNDGIYDGLGVDTLVGGAGDDRIIIWSGADYVYFNRGDGQDFIDNRRGSGVPIIVFGAGVAFSDLNIVSGALYTTFTISDAGGSIKTVLRAGLELRFSDTGEVYKYEDIVSFLTKGTDLAQSITGFSGADNISALGGADTILGLAGADTLNGGSGDDSLDGGADADLLIGDTGADTLIGGDGIDTLIGGMGSDTYVLTGDGDVVQEKPSEGYDTIQSSATATLADNFEKLVLTGTANVNGTGTNVANELVGNEGINVLNGLGGADTLRGGAITAGRDSLYGGAGDDVYILSGNAQAIEQTGEGTDTVQLDYATGAAGYTLGENIEKGRILSTAGGVLYGNRGANSLNGASGNDALYGGIGVDRLYGGDGNDTLEGGAGTDFLVGGLGSDTYVYEYGDGFEVINSFAPDAANADKDTLIIKGLTQDQLWFERDAQDLVIRVVGDVTFVNVLNWFDGSNAQVDTIKLTETGKALTADKVAGLVSAMANFAPPALSANAIDAGVLTALAPVLTASWLDAA